MSIMRVLNEPLEEAPHKPSTPQRRWMRARILAPKKKPEEIAAAARVHPDRVKFWYLNKAFVAWVEACEKRSELFWIHEVRRVRRAKALDGDFRHTQAYLQQNDPEVIRRKAEEAATAAIAAPSPNFNIAVSFIDPRDPEVLRRQARIIELNASPSGEAEPLEAVSVASARLLPSTASSEPADGPETEASADPPPSPLPAPT